jgi:hypothetical protein
VQHFQSFNEYQQINEKNVIGSILSFITIGGYLSQTFKNAFGIRSSLIKSKISKIKSILEKGLLNLQNVLPSKRVIQNNVNQNQALKRVKDLVRTKNIAADIYSALEEALYAIEEAILTYEKDSDLDIIKTEVEELCNNITKEAKVPDLSKFNKEIDDITKNLRLSPDIVNQLTQKLPRYDLKNISLEASILVRAYEGKDNRLAILWQKLKNQNFSKFEKFYNFDELNNWLDYEKFDPSGVKYRQEREKAEKQYNLFSKNNNVITQTPPSLFKSKVGKRYYFSFTENDESLAICLELIRVDDNIEMYKPYGLYSIKAGIDLKFELLKRNDKGKSIFSKLDFISTNLFMYDYKMFFEKGNEFLSRDNKYNFSSLDNSSFINEITFNLNNFKDLTIFEIDEKTQVESANMIKKYNADSFTSGLKCFKDKILKHIVKKETSNTAKPVKEEPKEGGFKITKLKVADEKFMNSIHDRLVNDVTIVNKKMGSKLKDDKVKEFVGDYLKRNVNKIPNDYDKILAAITKELLKK